MSQRKKVQTMPADLLRMALALTVLQCKPETTPLADFVLQLRSFSIRRREEKADRIVESMRPVTTVSTAQPSASHKEVSDNTHATNKRIESLQQEVNAVKRKLEVAKKELSKRAKSLEKVTAHTTAHSYPPSAENEEAFPKTSSNIGFSRAGLPLSENSHATIFPPPQINNPAIPTPLHLNKDMQYKPEGCDSIAPSIQGYAAKPECGKRGSPMMPESGGSVVQKVSEETSIHGVLNSCGIPEGYSVPFADLPGNVKSLQALLSTSSSPGVSPNSRNLSTIMDQARNIISQLSQVARLAFSVTASRDSKPGQIGAVSGTMPSGEQTSLSRPAKIIGLVESLLSRLLPPLFVRLESAEARKITLSIVNGIVDPSIDALIAACALPSGQDGAELARMVDPVTSLLHCLLPIRSARTSSQTASVAGSSAGIFFPFAEVISLRGTDVVYAKVKHAIDQDSKDTTGQSTTHRQSTKNPTLNALINTLLGVVGRCIDCLSSVKPSGHHAHAQMPGTHHQGPFIRLVNTRICDLLTRIIAELDSEFEMASTTEPAPSSFVNAITSLPIRAATESVIRNPKSGRALWERIGLEKGTWLAMCCVAEQMMINEGEEIGADNFCGSSFGWLEEICGKQQECGVAR